MILERVIQLASMGHGTFGAQNLGRQRLTVKCLALVASLSIKDQSQLLLFGCHVGAGTPGRSCMHHLADTYHLQAVASSVYKVTSFDYGLELNGGGYWWKAEPQSPSSQGS